MTVRSPEGQTEGPREQLAGLTLPELRTGGTRGKEARWGLATAQENRMPGRSLLAAGACQRLEGGAARKQQALQWHL